MDALFTAVDISSLSTNTSALMISFIGVALLFVGFRYIKRILRFG
ncbi:hypothetical protein [Desulfolithobacter sp.]